METVGVEMVVTGLQSFLGDMKKADSGIQSLIPTSGLLNGALSTLGNIASSVGNFIANTLAHAVGELLADAVQWATSKIQELITSAIEAGDQFQALTIRLNQMNFNTAMESTNDYAKAIALSTEQTKEQLLWIQKLATATPFELDDVTKVYSMARSYSFADDEARDLVTTLADFTAGMGLGGDEMVSIIRQFGQMRNTGKILQKDLNSLAEGGMVPVNKILDIMKQKTGLTGKAFDEFKLSTAGATMFLETFTSFVKDNYVGAAEKANRTFKNATITLKEFFTSFAASNVVVPILDVLGQKIASLNDALSARLPQIIGGFDRIGKVLADILTKIIGLGPSADEMADGFVNALNGIADWLEEHSGDIVTFFEDGIEKSVGLFEDIKQVLSDLSPLVQPIKDLFSAILEVAGVALGLEFGDLSEKSFAETVKSVAKSIGSLAKWISNNKEDIAYWITKWAEGAAIMLVLATMVPLLFAAVKELVFAFIGWAAEGNNLIKVLYVIAAITAVVGLVMSGTMAAIVTAILAVPIAIFALIAAVALLAYMVYQYGEQVVQIWIGLNKQVMEIMKNIGKLLVSKWLQTRDLVWGIVEDFVVGLIVKFVLMASQVIETVSSWVSGVIAKFNEMKVMLIAKATEIKNAVVSKFNEIKSGIQSAVNAIADAIQSALDRAMAIVDGANFWSAGYAIMTDLASGVKSGAGLLYDAVQSAAQSAWNSIKGIFTSGSSSTGGSSTGGSGLPGSGRSLSIASPVGMTSSPVSQVTTTNNYNLYINSSSPIEPVIADFQMLASLNT